jgi:predicted trehalose synthase
LVDRAKDHTALAERMEGICEETESLRDDVKVFANRMDADLMALKKAISGMLMGGEAPSKLRSPEPKSFTGARSAKELENFLWDMKQYFRATRIPKEEMVTITTMYLTGDTKLWWRTHDKEDLRRPKV